MHLLCIINLHLLCYTHARPYTRMRPSTMPTFSKSGLRWSIWGKTACRCSSGRSCLVSKVYFQFQLPGQTAHIRLSGQVVWQEWNGRAGIQFVDVPKSSRRLLHDFLAANLPNPSRQPQFSGVTVEVEDSLQLATVSVSEQTHGNLKSTGTAYQSVSESVAAGQSAADNRRTHPATRAAWARRFTRTGTSVPNHCCLTDLSSGGCYLEVPLSLPAEFDRRDCGSHS